MNYRENGVLVSVIMPAYNDAGHIKESIRSVLNQTLQNIEVIVVDDHSSDNTPSIVQEIARHDRRVKLDQLSENTGAAGAPRNRGISMARGKYVFFLDSDDELDRHALKNLYFKAEKNGSDFVVGQTVRYNLVSKHKHYWQRYLFKDDIDDTSILKYSDLLNDTLITNKLFRKSFLIDNNLYFEPSIHYEDVIYAAHVYANAKSISIIKDVIYIWKIYDTNVRKSITNQRDSIKSLEDRLYANSKRNQIYSTLHSEEINKLCDMHFLKQSAILYLMDSSDYEDEYLDKVIEMLYPVVKAMPDENLEALDFPNRCIYGMLILKDRQGLRELSYHRKYGNKLAGVIRRQQNRDYWMPSNMAELPKHGLARRLMDVTDSNISNAPISSLVLFHNLTNLSKQNNSICLSGVTHDALNKFDFSKDTDGYLIMEKRGNPDVYYRFKMQFKSGSHGVVKWSASIPNFNFSMHHGYEPWSIYMKIIQKNLGYDNKSSVHVPGALDLSKANYIIRSTSMVRAAIGSGLLFYRAVNGNVSLRHVEYPRMSKAMGAYKRLLSMRSSAVGVFDKVYRAVLYRLIDPVLRVLPLNKRVIFFESQLGEVPTGSPLSIYEAAIKDERFSGYRFVWSCKSHYLHTQNYRTSIVRRNSIKYHWYLATAGVLIDDQTFPGFFVKRDNQVYVQTWHGIPLKKMGLDEPSVKRSEHKKKDILRRAAMWTGLIAPSRYFVDTFAKAFGYKGKLIKWGTPRNDRLMSYTKSDISRIKQRLDLPTDRKIILYTPTFRESNKHQSFKLQFDMEKWREVFGKEAFLLIRTHYLNKITVSNAMAPFCMDVSKYPDPADLYIVSDIMITDYSSTMFDYSILKRPIIFFTYDYDEYADSERGTYFDLKHESPGEVVYDEESLFDAIVKAMNNKKVSEEYLNFIENYCGREDGKSTERVLEFIIQDGES